MQKLTIIFHEAITGPRTRNTVLTSIKAIKGVEDAEFVGDEGILAKFAVVTPAENADIDAILKILNKIKDVENAYRFGGRSPL